MGIKTEEGRKVLGEYEEIIDKERKGVEKKKKREKKEEKRRR
ncbi:hypothetical protein [Mycobacterium canetti]|nr:hypothetical protein [Mycobacterium canetti]